MKKSMPILALALFIALPCTAVQHKVATSCWFTLRGTLELINLDQEPTTCGCLTKLWSLFSIRRPCSMTADHSKTSISASQALALLCHEIELLERALTNKFEGGSSQHARLSFSLPYFKLTAHYDDGFSWEKECKERVRWNKSTTPPSVVAGIAWLKQESESNQPDNLYGAPKLLSKPQPTQGIVVVERDEPEETARLLASTSCS